MAQSTHGSVRMGPISIFTLVIVLCLVVLSVLSYTAALAQDRVTQRQAATTASTYALEVAGQTFMADVDGYLASDGASSDGLKAKMNTFASGAAQAGYDSLGMQVYSIQELEAITSITGEAELKGDTINATFVASNGRTLSIALTVLNRGVVADTTGSSSGNGSANVSVTKWEITTQWEEDTSTNNIWDGSVGKAE